MNGYILLYSGHFHEKLRCRRLLRRHSFFVKNSFASLALPQFVDSAYFFLSPTRGCRKLCFLTASSFVYDKECILSLIFCRLSQSLEKAFLIIVS